MRLFEDRYTRVGFPPKGEEVVVGCFCFRFVPGQDEGPPQLQVGECADGIAAYHSTMVKNFLELR